MPVTHDIGKAKICKLDMVPCIKQQVLWFQISVYNHVAMATFQTRYNLLEKVASFLLWESAFFNNIVKEFPRFNVLHHDIDVHRCLYDLIETNDVWVVKEARNFDFSLHYITKLADVHTHGDKLVKMKIVVFACLLGCSPCQNIKICTRSWNKGKIWPHATYLFLPCPLTVFSFDSRF